MNVYLAAKYEKRAEMRVRRRLVEAAGHRVIARWLDDEGVAPADADWRALASGFARMDFDDIDASDLVIVESAAEDFGSGTGGRHVECGYALARGKRVVIVGARENVFHFLTPCVLDEASLLVWLGKI